jgi:hypothetical protein
LHQEGDYGLRYSEGQRSTTPNQSRAGPDFDLLVAAQDVLLVMSDPDTQLVSSLKSASSGSIFEHSRTGSTHSIDTSGKSTTNSQFLSSPAPVQSGKVRAIRVFTTATFLKRINY